MEKSELQRQFSYRQLLGYNAKLKSDLLNLRHDYNILQRQQENIINKEVTIRTKELTDKIKTLEETHCIEKRDYQSQIEVLKKELAKKQSIIDNNSENSGIPTSKTPIGQRKHIPNTREKTDKLSGGQVGHKKHKLVKFKDEEITDNVSVVPPCCPKCKSEHIGVLETNITKDETDYDVKLIKRRYEFPECECLECSNTFRAKIPDELKEENQYGTTVQALCVCLTNEIYTPFNKTVKLVSGITDGQINLSEGYVIKLQSRASGYLDEFINDCKKHMIKSDTYGWDDGVIQINTHDAYLRIYATEKVSLFFAHVRKNEEGLDEDGILSNTSESTTVMHDHLLHNYNDKYRFKNVECLIHLIRRLKKSEQETSHDWPLKLKKLLSKTNDERNKLIDEDKTSFDKIYLEQVNKKYDEIISEAYKINDEDTSNYWFKEELGFIKDLDKFKKNYLLWTEDFSLPSTNNNCERNIRPVKSKMKISGHFRDIKYAEYYARIRSYIETCKRNGINIITACIRLMIGNPFTLHEILNYQDEK